MFYWECLLLGGLVFLAGAFRLGLTAFRATAPRARWGNLALLLTLVPVALWSVRTHVGVNLIGSGDSYYYALQVADLISQLRQGVLPVVIGQSDYAFNGNVYVRTAPYFAHLAGLLDLLTARTLSITALQNLTIATTAVFTAWVAFLVCWKLTGGRRVAAWLLAVIYTLSPGILTPLLLQDMYATYLTAPWLLLCWYGFITILERENDAAAQTLTAGALAFTWYAHPPIAAWCSLLWAAIQTGRLLTAGGRLSQWGRQAAAGLLFAGLAAYAFVAMRTLGSGPALASNFDAYIFDVAQWRLALQAEFTPLVSGSPSAGIQLGWTLWLLLAGSSALLVWQRHRLGLSLLLLVAIYLALLLPVPLLSEFLWRRLPAGLVAVSNWPAQRLCPVLGAGILALSALALRLLPASAYRAVCVVLAIGAAWSAVEAASLHRRPTLGQLGPDRQDLLFSPQNLRLTRYAYALFPGKPDYFTNNWTSPEFESRLLDAELDPSQHNAAAILAAAPPGPAYPLEQTLTLTLPAFSHHLLAFTFVDHETAGEIIIQGGALDRNFTLPRSGGPLAFGSAPGCATTVPLSLDGPGPHTITIRSSLPGTTVRVIPYSRSILPVQVHSQTPYHASVTARVAGFLETPRVYVEGYTATILGQPVTVRRSPQGLAMVPVPAGPSQVILRHPGPPALRGAWLLTLATFAAWPWWLARARRQPGRTLPVDLKWNGPASLWAGFRRHQRTVALALGTTLVLVILGVVGRQLWREHQAYGSIRFTLELPKRSPHHAEPLLTIGQTGAADCVYIIYVDPQHIRLALDHWGVGGPISEPIPISFGQVHTIEVTLGGLFPASRWGSRPAPPTGPKPVAPFKLALNGKIIFSRELPFYQASLRDVYPGANPVGCSVAVERFTGKILKVERLPDQAPWLQTATGR